MAFRHTVWLLAGASFCVCSTALAGDASSLGAIQKGLHDTNNVDIGKMKRTAPSGGGKQVGAVKSSKGARAH